MIRCNELYRAYNNFSSLTCSIPSLPLDCFHYILGIDER